jgi:dipeptidyl aminopeptidase/acylaminoacyl peptidase
MATMPRIAEKGSPEQRLLGCDGGPCDAPISREASPLGYADAADPPFLLVHGEADTTVPVTQSRALEAALQKAGVSVRSLYFPGVEHSLFGRTPEETRKVSMQAIEATFDYFHEKLGVPRK